MRQECALFSWKTEKCVHVLNLMWCPVESISIRIKGLSEFPIVWNEKRQQSEAERVKGFKKKKKNDGAFRLFSLVWATVISFWNMGRPCHFHLPFLAALHIFTHFPLVLLPKSGLFSLGIPREILTNAHKGGPWMTLHMHRPRTRQDNAMTFKEKVLEILLLLGYKTVFVFAVQMQLKSIVLSQQIK